MYINWIQVVSISIFTYLCLKTNMAIFIATTVTPSIATRLYYTRPYNNPTGVNGMYPNIRYDYTVPPYNGRKLNPLHRYLIDDDARFSLSRFPTYCPPIIIPNAVIKYRKKNRIAKIRCKFGFGIIGGDRRLTCIRNKWKGRIPHCITVGCEDVSIQNGGAVQLYSGALIHFTCYPGFQLRGSPSIFCDGSNWNDTTPTCVIPQFEFYHTNCIFELRTICDWIQDHLDDYNWKFSSGVMNKITASLGPKTDHTINKSYGHYIYVDSNENWSLAKKARLFSPILNVPTETPSCVTLWYHMNGPTSGSLSVYVKEQSIPFEIMSPRVTLVGNHYDRWNRLVIHINDLSDDTFQIVLEASGGNGYMSDIAVDDFKVLSGTDCINVDIEQAISTESNTEGNGTTLTITGTTKNIVTTETIALFTTNFPEITNTTTNSPVTQYDTSTEENISGINGTSMIGSSSTAKMITSTISTYNTTTVSTEKYVDSTPFISNDNHPEITTSTGNYYNTSAVTLKPSIIYTSSVPVTLNSQTTKTSFTEPQKLSFASTSKPLLAAPILVAIVGLLTIASILAVYWVKRKKQSALYEYSDIRSENERSNTVEEPVQRDTSNYIPLGDDSLVHIDFE